MSRMETYACATCGKPFQARGVDRRRGWARFCSKSCKAIKPAKDDPGCSEVAEATVARFDMAALDWGWQRDQGSRHGALASEDEYIAAKAALVAEIRQHRAAAFALAANQCESGYAGEYGHHGCRIVDQQRERAEKAEAENERLRAENERLVETLADARDDGLIYWEPQTARGRVAKAEILARIDAALAGEAQP